MDNSGGIFKNKVPNEIESSDNVKNSSTFNNGGLSTAQKSSPDNSEHNSDNDEILRSLKETHDKTLAEINTKNAALVTENGATQEQQSDQKEGSPKKDVKSKQEDTEESSALASASFTSSILKGIESMHTPHNKSEQANNHGKTALDELEKQKNQDNGSEISKLFEHIHHLAAKLHKPVPKPHPPEEKKLHSINLSEEEQREQHSKQKQAERQQQIQDSNAKKAKKDAKAEDTFNKQYKESKNTWEEKRNEITNNFYDKILENVNKAIENQTKENLEQITKEIDEKFAIAQSKSNEEYKKIWGNEKKPEIAHVMQGSNTSPKPAFTPEPDKRTPGRGYTKF